MGAKRPGPHWIRRVPLVLLIALVAAVLVNFLTEPGPQGPTAGLSLAFNQTFGGTSLDRATWGTCYAWFAPASGCTNFGNPIRDAWYLPSGVQVSGGALHLVATKTPTEGTTESGSPDTYSYTSGMVTTRKSFNFTYGYVSIKAKISGGAGTWPALWLLPKSGVWPPEIDIMENWGSTHEIRTTVFWSASNAVGSAAKNFKSPANLTAGYHTYGLLWRPDSLTWYLDGKVVDRYIGSHIPNQPMYVIANLAIDGPAASGSSFSVSSVKIYKHS
jgi:beta-glucanase (GH16 family)